MFRHITMGQARKLRGAPYQYLGDDDDDDGSLHLVTSIYQIDEIAAWSDEVGMKIMYTPGFLYFENPEDRLNFRLRWC